MTDSHTCANCTGDHDHTDPAAFARTRRTRLTVLVAARAGIVVLAVALAVWWNPGAGTVLSAGYGLALWVLSTVAGVFLAARLTRRRGQATGAMLGSLLAAALAAALIAPLIWWPGVVPAAIAAGYLTGAFGAEAVRALTVRALLGADNRTGEVARESAALTRAHDRDLADLLGTGLMATAIGLYAWLVTLLAPLALVLVPLHVAIVAVVRRRALRRPGRWNAVNTAHTANDDHGTNGSDGSAQEPARAS